MFDYKVRHGPSHWHGLGAGNTAQRGPVNKVHIDQSSKGAEIILRKHLPEEADELLKKRYQIVNVSLDSSFGEFHLRHEVDLRHEVVK